MYNFYKQEIFGGKEFIDVEEWNLPQKAKQLKIHEIPPIVK